MYGQCILADYLLKENEKEKNEAVVYRNTDTGHKSNTQICGHLFLCVLKSLSLGKTFREVFDFLTTDSTGTSIQWTNSMANELNP